MITVLGEALIDRIIYPDGDTSEHCGGGPFNVSRTIGRLGGDVRLVCAIGNDAHADEIIEQLQTANVNIGSIQRVTYPTSIALARLNKDGHSEYTFLFESTASPQLKNIPRINREKILCVGTLGCVLEPMASVIKKYIDHLFNEKQKPFLVFDPNCRKDAISDAEKYAKTLQHIISYSSVMKISDDDFCYMKTLYSHVHDPEDLFAFSRQEKFCLIVTQGKNLIDIYFNNEKFSIRPPRIRVADTIGAGDSFIGGFLWLLQKKKISHDIFFHLDIASLKKIIVYSTEVASITCQRPGADPPFLHELNSSWKFKISTMK